MRHDIVNWTQFAATYEALHITCPGVEPPKSLDAKCREANSPAAGGTSSRFRRPAWVTTQAGNSRIHRIGAFAKVS